MTDGPEARLWIYLRQRMRGRWHATRHEDRVAVGVADVSYAIDGADGWLELKALRSWPARDDTPVDVGLRPEQAAWLERRGMMGSGRCFVLVRVGGEHLLFRWTQTQFLREKPTGAELREAAIRRWTGPLDTPELVDALKEGWHHG